MSTYEVVLFLHIGVALFAFGVAGVLHTAMFRLRSSDHPREMRTWVPIFEKAEPLFPISAVLLLGLGGWLLQLSDGQLGWGDGWVITAIVTLVLVEALGAAVLGPRMKRLGAAIEADTGDTVSAATRAAVSDRGLWIAAHTSTGAILGIVMLMATKPSGAVAAVVVAVAAVVGAASAFPFAKPAEARSSAPEAATG